MPQLERIKIFLASPGDVGTERRHVEKVVDELNRTTAAALDVWLVLTSSNNAFPGYGKDGQAILNEQFGEMHGYELFIGIMWNRIGTPTPRAKSGTVEEFTQAVRSLVRKKKPDLWFYFRQSPASFTTKEELKQKGEVVDFRAKFQKNGLFRDYKNPADFRDQLRQHLTLWLNHRKGKSAKSSSTGTRQNTTGGEVKSKSPIASDRRKAAPVSSTKAGAAKMGTGTRTSAPSRKASASKSRTVRSTSAVKNPGDWVMLDGIFFQAKLSDTRPDRSILLQIAPKDMKQSAELKSFRPEEFHHRKQITFADSHEAKIMQVSSVAAESAATEDTCFSITLNQDQRSQNSGFGMEMNYQNYSADQVAELRARLILLGEPLPKEIGRLINTQITNPYNHVTTLESGIFPELWAKLQTQPRLFLPKAWLWAVYHLKMCQIVEDVLVLELGPVKNKMMPVRFQGKRKQFYSNLESSIVNVIGNCTLSA